MKILSNEAERDAVIQGAKAMAAAARTAPKTKGLDYLETVILTDGDIEALAVKMDEMAEKFGMSFIARDAGNLRKSTAVLLLGVTHNIHGLGEVCGFCGHHDCKECRAKGGGCAFDPIDLGIAVGSAVSVAKELGLDNRVMFSAGAAARDLGLFDSKAEITLAIPLSTSGKSIYFDRK